MKSINAKLFEACEQGMSWEIAPLLGRSASLDARDGSGRCALMIAAHHGQYECIKAILGESAPGTETRTPSDTAIASAEADKPALETGAQPWERSWAGIVSESLEDAGGELSRLSAEDSYCELDAQGEPAQWEWGWSRRASSWRDGLAAYFGLGSPDPWRARRADPKGRTALMLAAMAGHPECVGLLLEVSMPMQRDADGCTALMLAAHHGDDECVKALLPRSDPLARSALGRNALMLAARAGKLDSLRSLLSPKAARARDAVGKTALISAAAHGHAACVRRLLALSDARACDRDGRDAFMWAAAGVGEGRLACLELLMPCSDPRARDKSKSSALMLACAGGFADGARLLLPASDPRARDCWGATALIHAAKSGSLECARLLMPASDHGARDKDGKTASDWAQGLGKAAVHELIAGWSASRAEKELLEEAIAPKKAAKEALAEKEGEVSAPAKGRPRL